MRTKRLQLMFYRVNGLGVSKGTHFYKPVTTTGRLYPQAEQSNNTVNNLPFVVLTYYTVHRVRQPFVPRRNVSISNDNVENVRQREIRPSDNFKKWHKFGKT
jgi:hypothetical protein